MSANTPCRNPKLCGVKTHRPGTVAACMNQSAGGAGKSASANLTAAPVKLATTTQTPEFSSDEAKQAYGQLQDGGYYGYPQLEDEQFLEKLASQKNLDPDAVKEAAEIMNSEYVNEQLVNVQRHAKRSAEIIAQTPHHGKYVKTGMRVVVDDGTADGRIVKVETARNGKIWGTTIDSYSEEYIDGWDINKIKVPKD